MSIQQVGIVGAGQMGNGIAHVFALAGYDVLMAEDGARAIELAQQHHPDMAVVDIVMPGLDGYAVCEKLKELGSPLCELPIVFLTCVKSRALELLGREYGAYLNKPVQADQLLATIENELSRSV